MDQVTQSEPMAPVPKEHADKTQGVFDDREMGAGEDIASIERVYRWVFCPTTDDGIDADVRRKLDRRIIPGMLTLCRPQDLALRQNSFLGTLLYVLRHQIQCWPFPDNERGTGTRPRTGLAPEPETDFHGTGSFLRLLCSL